MAIECWGASALGSGLKSLLSAQSDTDGRAVSLCSSITAGRKCDEGQGVLTSERRQSEEKKEA